MAYSEVMTTTTRYQPKFLRAGQELTRKDALKLIVKGCFVTVAVPDEDVMGMDHLDVTIKVATTPDNDPYAYGSLPATAQLDADDLGVYAAVMAAAASLCADATAALNRQ